MCTPFRPFEPLADEAAFLIATDGAHIEGQHAQVHPVQVQAVERVLQHQPDSKRASTVAQ